MKRKRMSKKAQNLFQSIIFFGSTILVISCSTYLWVYTEIDETLLFIEIQTSTIRELKNEIYRTKEFN